MTKKEESFLCKSCSRRDFLKQSFLAVTAVTLIHSFGCSATGSNEIETDNGISYNSANNVLLIDTTGTDGKALASNNELLLINGTVDGVSIDMMAVRVNDTVYAYNSTCPHAGTRTRWALSGDNLTCNAHGNWWRYDNSSQKNSSLNALTSYTATESGNTITIQL